MKGMVGSPDNPRYTQLVERVVNSYLATMPEIMLAEERWVITCNETYWMG